MNDRYAVVLSGGSGTRLWPLSRSLRPKQLLALNGEQTLLQQTARRLLRRIAPQHLYTVTHQDHRFEVKGQLSEVAQELVEGVFAEPCARNTLPAIAWVTSVIAKKQPDAIVGVFPSDHAIGDEVAFLSAWEEAEVAASVGFLALIGISPTEPATGYGYIQPGEQIDIRGSGRVLRVMRFIEKPDQDKAVRFVQEGYLWNGGMFVFRAADFMEMLRQHQPQVHALVSSLTKDNLHDVYPELANLSMDYGVVEKAEKVAVIPVDMDWSDLGNWDSIYHRHAKDEQGNLIAGDVIQMDTQGSLLWNSHGLLATLGVSNLAVIQTPDATLICNRGRTEEIRQLVARVQQTYPHLVETHVTVKRPWGTYTVLGEGPGYKIKRIVVSPGSRLSLQMHHHRSEHWVVVSGMAKVTNGERELFIRTNESTYIPAGQKHRLENPGLVDLVIIEVQSGQYLGEDDIVRFEDRYGRC